MNQIGIITAVIYCVVAMHLYLITIDIWNFAFALYPQSKTLDDMILKCGGRLC